MPPATPDALMHALADPTRRAIFERIALSKEASAGALAAVTPISQPAVSQHLKVLQDARLIVGRREGRNIFYRPHPHGLAPLRSWLQQYEQLWTDRFDRLDSYLRTTQRKGKKRGNSR